MSQERRGGNPTTLAAAAAVVVLAGVVAWQGWDTRRRMAELESLLVRVEKTAIRSDAVAERVAEIAKQTENLAIVGDEWEFVVEDVARMDTKLSKLTTAFEHQFAVEIDNPATQPPDLDWTEPALFEAARRSAESVGIALTKDEVRVPAKLLLRSGLLEYLAVLKGGKEHESLVSLVGNTPQDQRRPVDFGVKLNNAVQALGFARGRPIRFSQGATKPPEGEPVYLFLEWDEGDEHVVVRVEDLVWNRLTNAPMQRGKWVYIGSSFVPGDKPGETLFAADLTAEVVATYSAVNTIIDNTTEGAADDTVFLVASPRVPEGVQYVDFVIRRVDREPTRVFDDVPGPPAPGGANEQDEDESAR